MESYNWEKFYSHYDELIENWLSIETHTKMINADCYFQVESKPL